jgi:hypothetical protein
MPTQEDVKEDDTMRNLIITPIKEPALDMENQFAVDEQLMQAQKLQI